MNIYITLETEQRLWAFIEALDTEVGGFGYAFIEEDYVLWDGVFLVPQTVSHSAVDFDDGGIANFIERADADGVLAAPNFMVVSWHSHHGMRPFWSKTDDECVLTYAAANVKHLLSFVGCHDHSYRLRYDAFGPKFDHLFGNGGIQYTKDELALHSLKHQLVEEEIKANVRKHQPKPAQPPKAQSLFRKDDPGETLEQAFTLKDETNSEYINVAGELVHVGQLGWGYSTEVWDD
jgi:hypothetical protein